MALTMQVSSGKNGETQCHHQVAIVLQPRFAMAELMAMTEWLSNANRSVTQLQIHWHYYSYNAAPVVADNGMVLTAQRDLAQPVAADMLVLLRGAGECVNQAEAGLPKTECAATRVAAPDVCQLGIPAHWQHLPLSWFEAQSYHVWRPQARMAVPIAVQDVTDALGALLLPRLSPSQSQQLARQPPPSFRETQRHPIQDGRIHRALVLMQQHLEVPLDTRTLAARACLSVRQLERLFRRYFDETPARYYSRVRLQSARRLLRNPQISVTDAALACGFASLPHFCRIYREQFGVTPGRDR